MKNTRRTLLWLTTLLLLTGLFSIVTPALAIETDDDGYIPAGVVIDDDIMLSNFDITIDGTVNGNVFASGNDVVVNGTINGNLLINSARATINGTVNGSIAGTGWLLTVNGPVTGTIYFTGATLVIGPEARLSRNLIVSNYSIEIQPGAVIEKDLQGNSYQTIINGQILQNVSLSSAAIEIGGQIGGDLRAKNVGIPGSDPPAFTWMEVFAEINSVTVPDALQPGIRMTPEAQIAGQLIYSSEVDQQDAIRSLPLGGLIFEKLAPKPGPYQMHGQVGAWLLIRLRELLTLLALGAILTWRLARPLQHTVQQARQRPVAATAWGAVVLLGGYLLIILFGLLVLLLGILVAAVTLGGLATAVFGIGLPGLFLLTGSFTLLVVYGSKLVFAYLVGELLLPRFFPNQSIHPFFSLATGVLVYVLLRAIPGFSLLVALLATLIGLGAIWLAYQQWRHAAHLAAAGTAVAGATPPAVEVSVD